MNTPLLTFNAKSVSCDILEKTLVGRKDVVDKIFINLKQHLSLNSNYQSLAVAPRGSGKSHITKVLYCRLKNDPEIRSKVIIAYMIEDEAGIASFMHLIIHILDAMRRYEEPGTNDILKNKEEISNLPFKEQERELKKLLLKTIGDKKLILLIENFDGIISDLGDDAAALRDFMHEYDNISIVATAQSLTRELQNSKYPFYQFFETFYLKRLSFDETMHLVKALIEIEDDPTLKKELNKAIANDQNDIKAKIKAIYDLTYGNHRLIVHFFQFLKADLKAELSTVFIRQMNDLKSYYEQFVKNLSAQKQRIVQILSLNRSPLQPDEIAKRAFLPTNSITKQLSDLYKEGYVDKHQEGKHAYYEINEPLMRICFEINENPHGIAALFVDFLKAIYDQNTLKEKYFTFHYSHILEPDKRMTSEREALMYRSAIDRELNQVADADSLLSSIKDKEELNFAASQLSILDTLLQNIAEAETTENFDNIKTEIIKYELINSLGHYFYFKLGFAFFDKGNLDQAIEMYEKAINLDPNYSKAYYNLGIAFRKKGNLDQAIEMFEKAINLDPNYSKAYYSLGIAFRKKGNLDQAIEMYEKAINLNPNYSKAYNSLGNAFRKKGNLDQAIEMYEKAINLNPTDGMVYFNLGIAFFDKGNLDQAIEMYEKAINLNPTDAMAYNNLGNAFTYKGNLDQAIEMYEKAINLNPIDAMAYNNLGNAFTYKGNLDQAIEMYEKAINLNPTDAMAYNNLGIAFRKKGNLDQAIERYEKAINLNPTDAMAYFNLGIAFFDKGNLDQAIEMYEKAINLNPNYSMAYYNLGIAFRKKGNLDQAIEMYEKAINLDPTDSRAYYSLGIAFRKKGNLDQAIEMYEKAINHDPADSRAYINLGIAFFDKGNLDQAIEMYEKAINLNPTDVMAYNNLGIAFRKKGNLDQAIKVYEKAINLNPTHAMVYFNLGITYFINGNFEEASQILKLIKSPEMSLSSLLFAFLQMPNYQKMKDQTMFLNKLILSEVQIIQDKSMALIILQYSKSFYEKLGDAAAECALLIKKNLFKKTNLPLTEKYHDVITKYYLLKDKKSIYKLSKEERKVFMDLFMNGKTKMTN